MVQQGPLGARLEESLPTDGPGRLGVLHAIKVLRVHAGPRLGARPNVHGLDAQGNGDLRRSFDLDRVTSERLRVRTGGLGIELAIHNDAGQNEGQRATQGAKFYRGFRFEREVVTDPFLVGVFFGIIPSMGFLYILFREFEGLYEEKRLFRTFFLGMVAGFIVTFFEVGLGPTEEAIQSGHLGALLVYALLFGFFETGAFGVVLNWRTFRAKRDTPFYGVAFGLGFGAANVLFLLTKIVAGLQETSLGLADVIFLSVMGVYFIGRILIHATIGAWVGRGVSQGGLLGAVGLSGFVLSLYASAFYVMFQVPFVWVSVSLPFVALAAAVALVSAMLRRVLRKVVPPEVLREMEVHQRRLAREVLRDPSGDPPEKPGPPPSDQTRR